jgi:hypothetical protein
MNRSVHEGEAFAVLIGILAAQFALDFQLLLLQAVPRRRLLEKHPAGESCSQGLAQGNHLEEVGSAVQFVQLARMDISEFVC